MEMPLHGTQQIAGSTPVRGSERTACCVMICNMKICSHPDCTNEVLSPDKRTVFCSRSCANKGKNRHKTTVSNCAVCDKRLTSSTARCCSHKCSWELKRSEYIANWLAGKVSGGNERDISGFVRQYIYNLRGKACWSCGWNEVNPRTGQVPVQIDHIDGDSANNTLDNLRLLCPNCHSLTPFFGNAGHKSSRSYRYQSMIE